MSVRQEGGDTSVGKLENMNFPFVDKIYSDFKIIQLNNFKQINHSMTLSLLGSDSKIFLK